MTLTPEVIAALKGPKEQLFEAHRADPNFTGCGIGFRRRAGQVTSEPVVIAMVANKLPEGALSRRRLLPTSVQADGQTYGVDVVEVGRVYPSSGRARVAPADTSTTGPITDRMRPPLQGCSISNLNSPVSDYGTLGCIVTDNLENNGAPCVLSTNHILARTGSGTYQEAIIQPAAVDGGGEGDAIAALTRWVPLVFGNTNANVVDAAIAVLLLGDSSEDVADSLMAPIAEDHPAVGMVVASDGEGNVFLCQMNTALNLLNVSLLPATQDNPCVVAPTVGMNIEKVGRSSGYSSAVVDAVAVQITADYDGTDIQLSNMIWSQYLAIGGDSGSVACQGGDGRTFVVPPDAPCPLIEGAQTFYDLPTNNADNTLTNDIQSQFLTQSLTGNLMIGLVYMNSQVAIDRLQTHQGAAYNQPTAQTFFQGMYAKYRSLIASEILSPTSTGVVTQSQLNDTVYTWVQLDGPVSQGYESLFSTSVTSSKPITELDIWVTLWYSLIGPTLGMNNQQVISLWNEKTVYDGVYSNIGRAQTIVMP